MPLNSDEVGAILEEALTQAPDAPHLAIIATRIALGEHVLEETCGNVDAETMAFLKRVNSMIGSCGIFTGYGDAVLIVDSLAPQAFAAMTGARDACLWLHERWDQLPDSNTKREHWSPEVLLGLAAMIDQQLAELRSAFERTGKVQLIADRFKTFGIAGGSFCALAIGDEQAIVMMKALNPLLEFLRVHARVAHEAGRINDDLKKDMPES